jgi:tripartite-type tricarboxylate transporter receptor subunit TctC
MVRAEVGRERPDTTNQGATPAMTRPFNTAARIAICALAVGCAAVGGAAEAQDKFPSRFVKVITTTGTGTGPDVVLRIVADHLGREWGQQVIVENNSTGGGLVAAQQATSAAADGYTLLQASASAFTVLPIRQERAPTKVGVDVKPIGYMGDQPLTISVAPSLGVNSLAELIELSKKDPDKVLYAANASGTLPHMAGELFKLRSGAPVRYVPFRGGAEGLNNLMSGSVNMIIDGYAALEGTIKSGSLKPLAFTGAKRPPNFPEIPTVGETVPGYVAIGWAALVAPNGVPDAIVDKINADMNKVMMKPEVQKRLIDIGAYMVAMTRPELETFIKKEQEMWHPIVREILSKPAAPPAAAPAAAK